MAKRKNGQEKKWLREKMTAGKNIWGKKWPMGKYLAGVRMPACVRVRVCARVYVSDFQRLKSR